MLQKACTFTSYSLEQISRPISKLKLRSTLSFKPLLEVAGSKSSCVYEIT